MFVLPRFGDVTGVLTMMGCTAAPAICCTGALYPLPAMGVVGADTKKLWLPTFCAGAIRTVGGVTGVIMVAGSAARANTGPPPGGMLTGGAVATGTPPVVGNTGPKRR